MSIRGPWLGLNTTQPLRDVPANYAREALNVFLSRGGIRPRPSIAQYGSLPFGINQKVKPVSMFQWMRPGATVPILLLKARYVEAGVTKGGLFCWSGASSSGSGNWTTLIEGMRADTCACFTVVGDACYVCDGSSYVWRTDGTSTQRAGIRTPADELSLFQIVDATGVLPAVFTEEGVLSFAITYYDSVRGIESNPFYTQSFTFPVGNNKCLYFAVGSLPDANLYGFDKIRVYRRNLSKGEVGWRLVWTFSVNPNSEIRVGMTDDVVDALGTSSPITGPFAPSLNGLPPEGTTVSAYINGRMFYGAVNSHRLWFSEVGRPEYVDRNPNTGAFKVVAGDDGGGITGLAEHTGELVIGKPRGIWLLSGPIRHVTNDEVATGAGIPESTETLVRTAAGVGPANLLGGNGFVVAGPPSAIYYGADNGFYRWDGAEPLLLSDLIQPTWEAFARRNPQSSGTHQPESEVRQSLSYAIDLENQIIVMCQSFPRTGPGAYPQMLAYHWGVTRPDGVGAWTEYDVSEFNQISVMQPTCVCTVYAEPVNTNQPPNGISPLARFAGQFLVGCEDYGPSVNHGTYLCSDRYQGERAQLMPNWRWLTPALTVTPGLKCHFYSVKVLHELPTPAPPALYGPAPLVVISEVRPSAGANLLFYHNMAGATSRLVPIRAGDHHIQILVKKDPTWTVGWDPSLAIVGFELDAEPVGSH